MMNDELRRVACSIMVVGLLGAAACGEESPTSIGGSLLPGPSVETFEVLLDPADYLVSDTSFSGYVEPVRAIANFGYLILANEFEGALNARALAEFSIPTSIEVTDSTGAQRTDTIPEFIGGELVVIVDTIRSSPAPVMVEAFRATQSWNAASADWMLRVDTGDVELPWSEPGGSPGALAGIGTWTGSDTLRIPVDSATIEAWRDTTNLAGVVMVPSAGSRLRTSSSLELRLNARTSIVDTVVTVTADAPTNRIFIFDPPVPREVADVRVSGVPGWRSFVRFRERLDTLTVACPGDADPPGCRLALSEASISYAALVLEPVPPPAGFAPEGELRLGAEPLLVDSLIPIERSPLGGLANSMFMPQALPASRFVDPAEGPVELPITPFISELTRDTADIEERPSPNIALIPVGITSTGQVVRAEGVGFGFATFASRPRLRLLLTVPGDLGLR